MSYRFPALPVLRAHGVSTWGYSLLIALDDEPLRTQAALAESIGADKTRIIGVLDELQRKGLILREPDPADRRVRLLSITPEGRRVRESVQAAIQEGEERLLGLLPADDRRGFLCALGALSSLSPEEIAGGRPGGSGARETAGA